ncbi:hypothetical protein BH11PAT1_BH11PAT1_6980 [soil metagenome]
MAKKKQVSFTQKHTLDEKMKTLKKMSTHKDNLETVSKRKYLYRRLVFLSFLAGVIVLFAALTLYVKQNPQIGIDLEITKEVQEFHPVWFSSLMQFITFIGNNYNAAILTILVTGFIWYKKRPKEALFLLMSTIGGTLLSITVKNLIHRPRPDPVLINQVGKFLHNDSFPSGHTLFYVSFFGFLLYLTYALPKENKLRTFFLILFPFLILCVGPSRIFLGAHWFSDVLGAYLLGFIWLSCITFIYHRWVSKEKTV